MPFCRLFTGMTVASFGTTYCCQVFTNVGSTNVSGAVVPGTSTVTGTAADTAAFGCTTTVRPYHGCAGSQAGCCTGTQPVQGAGGGGSCPVGAADDMPGAAAAVSRAARPQPAR